MDNIAELLKREGAKIPLAEEADLVKTIEASLNSDFIPDEIKKMIQANRASIEASLQGVKIEVVAQTLSAIASVKKLIAAAAAYQGNPADVLQLPLMMLWPFCGNAQSHYFSLILTL